MNIASIPSNYYLPLKALRARGFDSARLKSASGEGGVLDRWRSKKTRRVYYRGRNLVLEFEKS